MSEKRVHFVSLGCPKNRVDTETMLAGLSEQGCRITGDEDEADIVVVNTCAFVEDAKVESIDTILEMARRKDAGQIEKLVVTGCLAQRYPEELANDMPEVDHLSAPMTSGSSRKFSTGIRETAFQSATQTRKDFDWELPRHNSMAGHTAYLKVSEGCSNACAFCIIPTLRGPQKPFY